MRSPEDETLKVTLDRTTRPTLTALWDGGGFTIPLPERSEIVIGRGTQADLVIDHPSISRRHATIHLGNDLAIEDLGSSNGTKVRAVPLRPFERASLRWGEPFELGKTLVTIQAPATGQEDTADIDPRSASMDEALRLIDLVAPTHISVLLLGETGVGKGYLAHRIHAKSNRATGPWLHLNCAALPEHLLESELFGHERGAFTGAGQTKPGLLETASGGTVFLDEVADLPPSVQAKLLIALERGEVMRIGGLRPQRFDVRFISATNRLLDVEKSPAFRPDLYYRLAGLPITIPPLRERRSEISGLAAGLIEEGCKRLNRPLPRIAPATLDALAAYDFPGNIRELASCLERALLLCGADLLPQHLGLASQTGLRNRVSSLPPASQRLTEARPGNDTSSFPPAAAPASSPPRTLAEEVTSIERRRIIEALEQCGGNQVRAAELLGISRRTLISRMITFGIKRPRKG